MLSADYKEILKSAVQSRAQKKQRKKDKMAEKVARKLKKKEKKMQKERQRQSNVLVEDLRGAQFFENLEGTTVKTEDTATNFQQFYEDADEDENDDMTLGTGAAPQRKFQGISQAKAAHQALLRLFRDDEDITRFLNLMEQTNALETEHQSIAQDGEWSIFATQREGKIQGLRFEGDRHYFEAKSVYNNNMGVAHEQHKVKIEAQTNAGVSAKEKVDEFFRKRMLNDKAAGVSQRSTSESRLAMLKSVDAKNAAKISALSSAYAEDKEQESRRFRERENELSLVRKRKSSALRREQWLQCKATYHRISFRLSEKRTANLSDDLMNVEESESVFPVAVHRLPVEVKTAEVAVQFAPELVTRGTQTVDEDIEIANLNADVDQLLNMEEMEVEVDGGADVFVQEQLPNLEVNTSDLEAKAAREKFVKNDGGGGGIAVEAEVSEEEKSKLEDNRIREEKEAKEVFEAQAALNQLQKDAVGDGGDPFTIVELEAKATHEKLVKDAVGGGGDPLTIEELQRQNLLLREQLEKKNLDEIEAQLARDIAVGAGAVVGGNVGGDIAVDVEKMQRMNIEKDDDGDEKENNPNENDGNNVPPMGNNNILNVE